MKCKLHPYEVFFLKKATTKNLEKNLVRAQRRKGVESVQFVSYVKEGNEVRMLDVLQLQIKAAGFKCYPGSQDL